MSKSSTIPTADASDKRQQQTTTPSTSTTVAVDTTPLNIQTKPETTIQAPIHAPTVTTTKNINQAEIQEEAQVENPDRFVDPHYPHKIYRLKKALYGLKQAPRAWYDELSNFLVSKGFSKGELKFFLRIQIHQSLRGIFISQDKYAQEILKKHGMTLCDSTGTTMATKPLDTDLSGTPVDQMKYHSMVEALMYLIAYRQDIVHATCYYARYQARPTEKHLKEVGPHRTEGTNISVAASFQLSRIHYHIVHTQALKVKHSASRLLLLNKNVFGQKAQVHVIILFDNSDNQELPHHQRSSNSNKESSFREIVSLRNIRWMRLLALMKKRS
ncbi:retrovirus-related pol polyprotein from transposon TNT 1-94 [Tanacetum coccineum]|uniref:Retrovirus-related pol polyprotein from transposon TNT 1-94 n=1 Tax=Tanacetum coccineum TaxID=301880 RepID=A0ABQ5HWI6_9ASTR